MHLLAIYLYILYLHILVSIANIPIFSYLCYAKIKYFILVGQAVHKRLSLYLKKTFKAIQKSCDTYNEFKLFEEEQYPSSISPNYTKDSSTWNNLCHDSPSAMHEEVMLLH